MNEKNFALSLSIASLLWPRLATYLNVYDSNERRGSFETRILLVIIMLIRLMLGCNGKRLIGQMPRLFPNLLCSCVSKKFDYFHF